MDLHYIHVRSSRVARSGCGLMRRWIHASVAKSGLTPVSWAPSLSVLRIIFNALFLTWGNATKTTCEGKQILLCGFCLFTQVNYCGNFITAPSLVHGFKNNHSAFISILFSSCWAIVLPRGDVIHASEGGGQLMPPGTRTGNQGKIKGLG